MYDADTLRSAGYSLMSRDAVTGRQVWGKLEGTKLHVKEIAPVDRIVAANKAVRAENVGRGWGDGAVAMRVPMHVLMNRLMEPLIQDDKKHLDRVLNSSEFDPFRVRDGRV